LLEILIPIILGTTVPAAAAILYFYFAKKKKKPFFLPPPPPPPPKIKVKTLGKTRVEVYVPVEEHDPEGYGIDTLSTVGYVKRALEEDNVQIDLEVKKVEYGTAWICKKCRAMYLSSHFSCPSCGGTLKEYKASEEMFFPKIHGKDESPMFLRVLPTVLIDGQIYVEGAKILREDLEEELRKLEENKSKLRKREEEKFWMKFANADYYVLPKQWYFDHPVRSPYAFRIVPRDQVRFAPDGRIRIMMRTAPDIPFSEETVEIMEKHGLKVLRWEEMTEYFQRTPIIEEEAPELSTELAKQKSKEYLERLEEW